MTREDLLTILTRYEGAVQEDSDSHSDESAAELEAARNDLMDLLLAAKNNLQET
jgi:hypothetical protein